MERRNNRKHQLEIANKIWNNYHSRVKTFSDQLLEEVHSLQKCFSLEKDVMSEAQEQSKRQVYGQN